jgi:ABA sandwich protein
MTRTLDPLHFEVSGHTDLWIAQYVMEWPVIAENDRFVDYLEHGGVIVVDRPDVFRYGTIPDRFQPSSKLEDAGAVLRKMIKKGWVYSIHGYPAEKGNMVVFSKTAQDYSATAETESLAICRAAGLAVTGAK